MFWPTQTKLKGLTPAIGASPNFVLPQKVLSDSNIILIVFALVTDYLIKKRLYLNTSAFIFEQV